MYNEVKQQEKTKTKSTQYIWLSCNGIIACHLHISKKLILFFWLTLRWADLINLINWALYHSTCQFFSKQLCVLLFIIGISTMGDIIQAKNFIGKEIFALCCNSLRTIFDQYEKQQKCVVRFSRFVTLIHYTSDCDSSNEIYQIKSWPNNTLGMITKVQKKS